jgi:hypothetical protein
MGCWEGAGDNETAMKGYAHVEEKDVEAHEQKKGWRTYLGETWRQQCQGSTQARVWTGRLTTKIRSRLERGLINEVPECAVVIVTSQDRRKVPQHQDGSGYT